MYEKRGNGSEESGGKAPSIGRVAHFLKENPSPTDDQFHEWAEAHGFNVHRAEEKVYQLASSMAKSSGVNLVGEADKKGLTKSQVRASELKKGVKVELEHTSDRGLAKQIAMDHLAEMPDYYTRLHKMEQEGKKKTSAALDALWLEYGPGLQKHAAADYLYRVTKPERDAEALTPQFCKLSSAFGMDPWALADEVAENISDFSYVAKHASDPRAQEMAKFYVTWAKDLEKRAGLALLKGIGGAIRGGAKALKAGGGVARPSFKTLTSTGGVKPTMLQGMSSGYRKGVQRHAFRTAQGGGSAARGGKVVQQRAARMKPHQGPPPRAPVQQRPPPPAPAGQAAAPAGAPASMPAGTSAGTVTKAPSNAPVNTPAGSPTQSAAAAKAPKHDWRDVALGGGIVGVPTAAYLTSGPSGAPTY